MTTLATSAPKLGISDEMAKQGRLALTQGLDIPPGLKTISQAQALELLKSKTRDDLYVICRNAANMMMWEMGLEQLEMGSTRRVFSWDGANSVVKTPYSPTDMCVNQLEVAYFEEDAYYDQPVVPCRILWLESGCPVVLMEKIDARDRNSTRMPGWGANSDGGQIARSVLLGKWAAYDAAAPMRYSRTQLEHGYGIGGNIDYARLVEPSKRVFEGLEPY